MSLEWCVTLMSSEGKGLALIRPAERVAHDVGWARRGRGHVARALWRVTVAPANPGETRGGGPVLVSAAMFRGAAPNVSGCSRKVFGAGCVPDEATLAPWGQGFVARLWRSAAQCC